MGDCHGRCGDAVQVQMFQIIGDGCGSVRLLQEQVYTAMIQMIMNSQGSTCV